MIRYIMYNRYIRNNQNVFVFGRYSLLIFFYQQSVFRIIFLSDLLNSAYPYEQGIQKMK